jgi:hypothetical protein
MKNLPSRRLFLRNSAIATTSIALFSSSTFATTFTSNDSPFDGYNPYAEEKSDLRTSSFGKYLQLKGQIFDATGTFTLANAAIEVWHLSPNSKKFKHRAKLKTDKLGEYSFITDFPNKEIGKCARIYFKVSNSTKEYFTELIVTDFGAHISSKHWEQSNQLGDKLLPFKEGSLASSTITFNISI